MKSKILMLCLFLFSVKSKGTIITVDNKTGSPAQYSILQDAINAASANDTLYISGSSLNYGSVSINKKLTIIGSGKRYNLPGNSTTNINGNIYLQNGSSGTSFMGMSILMVGTAMTCDSGISNISFLNCEIAFTCIFGNYADNWLFEGCLFHDNNNFYGNTGYGQVISNITYQNNIIAGSSILGLGGNNIVTGLIIKNNIFYSAQTNTDAFSLNNNVSVTGFTLENNIFFISKCGYNTYSGLASYLDNCSYLSSEPLSNGGSSIGNINTDPMLVNFPGIGSDVWDPSFDFHLQNGSPCIGTGTLGTDMGVYGGNQRFNASVLPPIPQIINFNLHNTTVPGNGALQLNATIINQH